MIQKFKSSNTEAPINTGEKRTLRPGIPVFRLFRQTWFILPSMMALGTVFVVRPELGNGIVSGKYFWFYLSMGIAAVAQVLSIRKPPVHLGLPDFLVLLFGILTLSISYFIHSSEAVTKHILLLLVTLLYSYFRISFHSRKQYLYWVVLFFLATGLIESCWGLRQLYGYGLSQHGRFKLTGSFFNPGPYACYIATVLPAAFYYLWRGWSCTAVKFKIRYWPVYLRWGVALSTFTGALLVLPAAMSRASWLGGLAGCGLVAFSFIIKDKKVKAYYYRHKKQCLLLVYCLPALFLLGCAGMYYLKKDSADGRALIWKISLRTALHHPMGVGIGNFPGSYGQEQAAYFEAGKGTGQEEYVAGSPEYGFNEYLQVAVEQGWLPFMLFLWIMGYSLYVGAKGKLFAATAPLLALLVAAVASYPFSVLPFLIVLSFLLAWIHSKPATKTLCKVNYRPFTLLSLLIAALCLYNRYPTYNAYKQWGQSKFLYQAEAYENGARAYAPLYPLLADQPAFLFEYAQCLSKSGQYEESNSVLQKAVHTACDPMLYNVMGKNYQAVKQYAKAEECFRKAAHIVPNRIYPWYLLTKLYMETNEIEKAVKAANIVLTQAPKVESTAIKEMRDEIRKIIEPPD